MPTETEKPKTENKIKLENVRLSYPNLFTAKGMKNPDGSTGKAKFSATFLLNKKEHAAQIAKLQKLIERVVLDKFQKKVPLKHVCLRDGAEKEQEGYGEETMFVPATTETRPAVVDGKMVPINSEDGKIYGGCYVNVTLNIVAYSHPVGGKGVSAYIRAVQFVKNGESFGAGPVNAEDEFEPVEEASDDVSKY